MNADASVDSAAGRATGRRTAVLMAVVVALAALGAGLGLRGFIQTGVHAEATTFSEAERMAAGDQRFGIVEYTHYPNGPLYLTAALTALGLDRDAMRVLPITVSAFCLGFLTFVLAHASRSRTLLAWLVAGFAVLFLQPAFVYWQGAIHEHSYAVSLAAAALALSARMPASRTWPLFPLGFVAGWIGYDWLPGQALVIFAARWLVYGRDGRNPLAWALAWASLDTLKFASGAALAILTHTVQLALYFGDLETALRDLLGSAAARAGAAASEAINPEYGAFIRQKAEALQRAYRELPGFASRFEDGFSIVQPARAHVLELLVRAFFKPRWTAAGSLLLAAVVGLCVTARELHAASRERDVLPRLTAVAAVGFGVALVAPVAWAMLMPQHGIAHLHMLPRHVLLCILLWIALPVVLVARPGAPLATGSPRALARSFAFHAVSPTLLLALYAYALLGLGGA